MPEPRWEKSRRRHGYWWGLERVGFIGVYRSGCLSKYHWSFDLPADEARSGRADTLRKAKRCVERAHAEYLAARAEVPSP